MSVVHDINSRRPRAAQVATPDDPLENDPMDTPAAPPPIDYVTHHEFGAAMTHIDSQFERMREERKEYRADIKSLRMNIWAAAITTILSAWGVIIAVQSMTLDAIQAGRETITQQAAQPIVIQLPPAK